MQEFVHATFDQFQDFQPARASVFHRHLEQSRGVVLGRPRRFFTDLSESDPFSGDKNIQRNTFPNLPDHHQYLGAITFDLGANGPFPSDFLWFIIGFALEKKHAAPGQLEDGLTVKAAESASPEIFVTTASALPSIWCSSLETLILNLNLCPLARIFWS
jgi:hypothetical protein